MSKHDPIELVLGGIAACGAGFFTNPLEVVKTRMQLQGELKHMGDYKVHYRNSLQAFYTIAKMDGARALQAGLVPALFYQFSMNGSRLGTFQLLSNAGLTKDSHGNYSYPRNAVAGAVAGAIGAFIASPLYLGVTGLWRGVNAAMVRNSIGSAIQLTAFSSARMYVVKLQIFHEDSWLNPFLASIYSGFLVVAGMTPFDVVSTRLYNQPVCSRGEGTLYKNSADCFIKIFREEGLWGFYKGWGPQFLRLCPHTILSLVFWDRIRYIYQR